MMRLRSIDFTEVCLCMCMESWKKKFFFCFVPQFKQASELCITKQIRMIGVNVHLVENAVENGL